MVRTKADGGCGGKSRFLVIVFLFEAYMLWVMIAIGGVLFLNSLLLGVVFYKFSKQEQVRRKVFRGSSPQRIEKALSSIQDRIDELFQKCDDEKQAFESFRKDARKNLSRFFLHRFNPFQESGGDQSFTLGILNDHHDGLLLTSLYNRGECRIYAKPITQGKSKYELSYEENEIITKLTRDK